MRSTALALASAGCLHFNPGVQPTTYLQEATELREAGEAFGNTDDACHALDRILDNTELETRRWMSIVNLQTFLESVEKECPSAVLGPIEAVSSGDALDCNEDLLSEHPQVDLAVAQYAFADDTDYNCLYEAAVDVKLPGRFLDTTGDGFIDSVDFDASAPGYCNLGFVPALDGGYFAVASCGLPDDPDTWSLIMEGHVQSCGQD